MKTYKLLAGMLFVVLACSAISTSAYTPQDEGFVEGLVMANLDKFDDIPLGTIVEFYVVVHNYTNGTISNITVNQPLLDNTEVMSIGGVNLTEDSPRFLDYTVRDDIGQQDLFFNYLNITNGDNITGNLDLELAENESFRFNFELNFTETGGFTFDQPVVTYFDFWGDEYTNSNGQGTFVELVEPDIEERRQYIPDFDTTEPNYLYIIGGTFAILAVALLGRVLHGKKPIEL